MCEGITPVVRSQIWFYSRLNKPPEMIPIKPEPLKYDHTWSHNGYICSFHQSPVKNKHNRECEQVSDSDEKFLLKSNWKELGSFTDICKL